MNNNSFCRYAALSLLFSSCCIPGRVLAMKTNGRITLGGVAITERYKSDAFGSTSNDYLLGTARFFYKISDVGADR